MAQTDTELGWSAKSEYLLGANLLFGVLNGGIDPQYIIPQKLYNGGALPTTGEMVMNGLYIGDDANGNARYLMCDVSTNAELKIAYVLGFQESSSTYINFLVSETYIGGAVGKPRFFTYTYGDQNVSYTLNSYITNRNNATGMYYLNVNGAWVENPAWGPVHYPTYGDVGYGIVISSLLLPGINCYKLNPGWAVACFASWWTPAGAHLISPILISTIETAVVLSTDGLDPATQTVVNFRYDGMTFYMSLLPGLDADVYTAGSTQYPVVQLEQFGAALPEKVFNLLASEDFANILVNETVDPYEPIPPSGEEGGEGDFDDDDDDIEDPPLPTLSFAATGFCRIYRSDLQSLRDLARYMWTDPSFLQTLINHTLQMFEDPMKAIITLNMLPVDLSGYYGSAEAVSVMYIPTTAAMWPMSSQFVSVDCGTLTLHEHFGSVLDYNPYTKITLFLPYIGSIELDTDEVMGRTLSVKYKIDVVSGICVAVVKADGDVRYQFSGHCAIPMPINSADFTGYIQAALTVGKAVAGAAMSAGAPTQGGSLLSPPLEGGGGGSTAHRVIKTRNPDTGRMRQAATIDTQTDFKPRPVSYGELIKRYSPNVIGAVMNSKLGVEHSSGFSGNSGYLGVRRPYITIKRPNPCIPTNYGQLNGRPSMIYLNLGTCTGYTEVQSIQLTGFNATNEELSELSALLKSGVIL